MAEALGNHLSNGRLVFCSAGTWPSRTVHPMAQEVMAEIGVDISGCVPKTFTSVPRPIHWIIAVCGQVEAECPQVPGARIERWEIDDPAEADPGVALAEFRRVRDELEHRVRKLLRDEKSDR